LSYQLWLEILCCPACVAQADRQRPDPGKLDLVAERWLVCRDCARKYPIRDQIPVMLIEEGDKHRETPVEQLVDPDQAGTAVIQEQTE
jgi:uncharacterized protein YbaR (Trm112 family)